MSASSINRKVADDMKQKKVERRNALIQRYKSENDIIKHIEVEERGIPAETSGSDSPEPIKAEAPKAKPKKPAAKKASRSKNGWSGKKLLSDS